MIGEHRISTFGLTEEQNEFVKQNTPVRDYEILDTDCPTDLIALSASALIVNASALEPDDLQMILDYYTEVRDCTDETVLWLGEPKPPVSLRKILKCYESFDAVRLPIPSQRKRRITAKSSQMEYRSSPLFASAPALRPRRSRRS